MKLRSLRGRKKFTQRSKTETEKDVESFLISYHTHYYSSRAVLPPVVEVFQEQNTEAEN